jgi:hypothetical protein
MGKDECFDVLHVNVALGQDVEHVFLDRKTGNVIVEHIIDVRDGVPLVSTASEIKKELFAGLFVLDVEGEDGEIKPVVAFDLGFD